MQFISAGGARPPKEAVVLPDNVYHSLLGEYFLGQTYLIAFGGGLNAWGGLVNPAGSDVNLFLNAYTITNFAGIPITAEGWLSSNLPGNARISPFFAAGNQAVAPSPLPKVQIQNESFAAKMPDGGTYTFVRRVEPNITLTKHDFQGMYIIPPGSSFLLYFLSPGSIQVNVIIAFGWWEERLRF